MLSREVAFVVAVRKKLEAKLLRLLRGARLTRLGCLAKLSLQSFLNSKL